MLSLLAKLLNQKHKANKEISVTGYEIYADFCNKAGIALTNVDNIDIANIHLIHSDVKVDEVFDQYHIIHSACAFDSDTINNTIKNIVKPRQSSTCLIPVLRPDGEQDLTVFQYCEESRSFKAKNSIMRAFFTEAKDKVNDMPTQENDDGD